MASYFLKRQSQVHGPLVGDNLLELARSGKVHPTDQISASKEGPWQSAGSVSALKAIFENAVQPPLLQLVSSQEIRIYGYEVLRWKC